MSDLEILRRIAERGLRKAQSEQSDYTDLFQHMIDEIARVKDGRARVDAEVDRATKERSEATDERYLIRLGVMEKVLFPLEEYARTIPNASTTLKNEAKGLARLLRNVIVLLEAA